MIIIIGGGLAGLALGQSFLQHNIPFHIYERDEASAGRSQGYRVRISEDGANALRSLVPPELFEQFDQTSSVVIPGGYQMDALTTEASPGGMPSFPGRFWNVDRATIRSILLTNLNPHISFKKQFSHYTLNPNSVTAHFTNSTSATGTLLIGADGIRSPVRRQLIPNYTVLDTQCRGIPGKTPLSALSSIPPAILISGIGVISTPTVPNVKLFCDTMRFHHPPSIPSSMTNSDPNSNSTLPPSISPPADYLYWVLLFPSSSSSTLTLPPSTSTALATALTKSFHPSLHPITQYQDSLSTSTITTTSTSTPTAEPLRFLMAKTPIQPHPTNPRVTLVGDAAHPMPPVGGVGANMAWGDARALVDAVLAVLVGGAAKEEVGGAGDGDGEGREAAVVDDNSAAYEGGNRNEDDNGDKNENETVKKMREALEGYEEGVRQRSNAWLGMAAGGIGKFLGANGLEEMEEVVW